METSLTNSVYNLEKENVYANLKLKELTHENTGYLKSEDKNKNYIELKDTDMKKL